MGADKIPEANPQVLQKINDLLEDPIGHLARERQESRVTARVYVEHQVRRRLAEQAQQVAAERERRQSLGRRVINFLRGVGAPHDAHESNSSHSHEFSP